MSTCSPELWRATYDACNTEQLNTAYKQWAQDYDRDTVQGMGYVGPVHACRMLDTYLESPKSRILDAGCGTGLVGEILCDHGYNAVEAMDVSPDMLRVAEEKACYDNVFEDDLSKRLKASDNTYDASICVGTFTYAHVGPEGFDELVRITKPGGYVCFTIRDGAYQEYGYRDKLRNLELDGLWKLQELATLDYLTKENVTAKFFLYEVN